MGPMARVGIEIPFLRRAVASRTHPPHDCAGGARTAMRSSVSRSYSRPSSMSRPWNRATPDDCRRVHRIVGAAITMLGNSTVIVCPCCEPLGPAYASTPASEHGCGRWRIPRPTITKSSSDSFWNSLLPQVQAFRSTLHPAKSVSQCPVAGGRLRRAW